MHSGDYSKLCFRALRNRKLSNDDPICHQPKCCVGTSQLAMEAKRINMNKESKYVNWGEHRAQVKLV